MNTCQRGYLVQHLSEEELDQAIEEAQSADETRLVRWLCFLKNLYPGDARKQEGRRVDGHARGRGRC